MLELSMQEQESVSGGVDDGSTPIACWCGPLPWDPAVSTGPTLLGGSATLTAVY